MTTSGLHPSEAIRAADADREKTLVLLREHWLAGRLSIDEYEERCEAVVGARYLHDLRAALRELPGDPPRYWPAPPHPALRAAPPAPPPAPASGALLSLVLGGMSLLALFVSFGMLFVLTLPASTWAWGLGRRTRRRTAAGPVRALATAGEACGIVATCAGVMALAACGVIVTAV
jgi:hypothetical protein